MSSFEDDLNKLKTEFQAENSYPVGDMMFVRFLRGHKGNVENAKAGLLKTVNWRITMKADEITSNDFETYGARRVTVQHGYDKFKRPVLYCFAGRHHRLERDIEEVQKFIIYILDIIVRISNPEEQKMSLVFDLTSFGLNSIDFESVKHLVEILQQHYPEILSVAYIVNSPFIFWSM